MARNASINFVVGEDIAHVVVVPRSTTFAEVRRLWGEFSPGAGPVFFLVEDSDGALLPEEGSVADLLAPERRNLSLIVCPEEEKKVRIMGSEREAIILRLRPLETVRELCERAKELCGLEQRVARLVSAGRVLEEEAPASEALKGRPTVYIDLRCRFLAVRLALSARPLSAQQAGDVENNEGLEARLLRHFVSEPARALCGGGESRVTAWGGDRSITGNTRLGAVVTEDALIQDKLIGVFTECQTEVFLEDKLSGSSGIRAVWPTLKLGDLRRSRSEKVFIGEKEADPHKCAWDAGLREGDTIILTRVDKLSVTIEGGRRCIL